MYYLLDVLALLLSKIFPCCRATLSSSKEVYTSRQIPQTMNLAQTLPPKEYMHLDRLLSTIASQRAKNYVSSIGSAAAYSRKQYFKRFDVHMYQNAQHKWFNEFYESTVYDKVFPHGPPNTFAPDVAKRDDIFFGGVSTSARQMFLAMSVRYLYKCIDAEWQEKGARASPPAIYF